MSATTSNEKKLYCANCGYVRGCLADSPLIYKNECGLKGFFDNEPWLADMVNARADNRLFIIPDLPQDMDNLLEPLKLQSALQSQVMKITALQKLRPKDLSILDYTILAALKTLLEQSETTLKVN